MRKPLFLLPLLLLNAINSFSQSSPQQIRKLARAEGFAFKLNHADSIRFRQEKDNYRSDLLKPVTSNVSDTLLLNDSTFVKAYRTAAYASNMRKVSSKDVLITFGVGIVLLVGTYIVLKSTAEKAFESVVSK